MSGSRVDLDALAEDLAAARKHPSQLLILAQRDFLQAKTERQREHTRGYLKRCLRGWELLKASGFKP